jgi:hypothetical protein
MVEVVTCALANFQVAIGTQIFFPRLFRRVPFGLQHRWMFIHEFVPLNYGHLLNAQYLCVSEQVLEHPLVLSA